MTTKRGAKIRSRLDVKQLLDWQTIQFSYAQVSARGRTLGLNLIRSGDDPEWFVFCAEISSRRTGEGKLQALQKIMDDHSHDVLGPFGSDEAAKEAAKEYAAAWKQGKRTAKCGCETIKVAGAHA